MMPMPLVGNLSIRVEQRIPEILMNGELSQQPLAELVREISQKGLSGTLRLQQGQAKVAVYFEAGAVVYAASNVRELRIAEYLKKQGVMSEQQLSALSSGRSDAALLAALDAKGANAAALEPLITRQVGDVLRVGLLWSTGTWGFDDRSHLSDPVRVKIDSSSLLLQTARKMDPEFVASRFSSTDEVISPFAGAADMNVLLPAEGFVLSRVDRPTRLGDLITLSGQPEAEAIRTIYGLALAGFIERERWPTALRGERARVASPQSDHATKARVEASPSQPEPTAPSEIDSLNDFLNRLDQATTHYEVLDVTTAASTDEIKTSYYGLAKRYHPDRFHLQASTELHTRIESAFARIAQAYETLMNPSRRTGYDAKLAALEKSRKFAEAAPKGTRDKPETGSSSRVDGRDFHRAEDNFKEGYAALQQGQTKLAITNLAAAARIVPDEPRYRAYYGRALAMDPETRRLAEAELQAAVRLEPSNAAYRVMLAELCFDLGFFKRAEGELERAMAYDQHNPAAQKLMRKLEAARTAK